MSIFFNGRKWVSPATMSVIDDSAMANQNLSVGNSVALIGRSAGGKPNSILRFGSPSQAQAALVSGELLDAVLKAFDPSAQTNGPSEVIAVRVNPATQSTLTLLDAASAPSIVLTSEDYGLRTNSIKAKVEAATNAGVKLTTQMGNDYYSQDDVARNAFSIQYTGAAQTAVASITGTSLVLQAPTGTTVATIDMTAYGTIQDLVDRINVVSGFLATVLDGNGAKPALNGLDFITNQDVKTSLFTVTAHLQAAVDWFNSVGEGFVNAARAANAGKPPTTLPFTYLTGGSDGVVTNTEWSNAYTTLQLADVQWVTPVSPSAAIHAMNSSHCTFMSNVMRKERRGIVGSDVSTSDTDAIAKAKALNDDRTSLMHIGFYAYNADGVLTLYPPYIFAALIAGAFAGVNPGTALTNKSVKVAGLERDLRNPTDTDVLIEGGVLCVENTNTGYKVVKSISTWLTNDNYNRVEVSTGVATDYTARSLREALDVLRGQKNGPILLGRAVSIAESALKQLAIPEPQGVGVLVGDDASPPYKNITATISGDRLDVSCQVSPAIPANYIPVTIYAVPYSGSSASATA